MSVFDAGKLSITIKILAISITTLYAVILSVFNAEGCLCQVSLWHVSAFMLNAITAQFVMLSVCYSVYYLY
jgi:hypothetical protein